MKAKLMSFEVDLVCKSVLDLGNTIKDKYGADILRKFRLVILGCEFNMFGLVRIKVRFEPRAEVMLKDAYPHKYHKLDKHCCGDMPKWYMGKSAAGVKNYYIRCECGLKTRTYTNSVAVINDWRYGDVISNFERKSNNNLEDYLSDRPFE